jgi:ABC-type sugar transport system substrate-binding protein
MALGALDALESVSRTKGGMASLLPRVVGYDGTAEMRSLILQGHPLVLGTVDVKIDKQAKQAVAAMKMVLEERDRNPRMVNPGRWFLVEPDFLAGPYRHRSA